MEIRNMSNTELLKYEDSLDCRDTDIIEEILRRAEIIEEGIAERYKESFQPGKEDTDELFEYISQILIDEK